MNKQEIIASKIVDLHTAKQQLNIFKLKNQQVVFTNGCFDLLHTGHIHLINEAANFGNKLIVAINSDASVKRLKGADRPIQSEQSRALIVASMAYVDHVIIFEEDTPLELIKELQPDVLVKGGDYELENIVGAAEVIANGGRVEIVPIQEGFSTTNIIEQLKP